MRKLSAGYAIKDCIRHMSEGANGRGCGLSLSWQFRIFVVLFFPHLSGFNTVICVHSVDFLPARSGLLSMILCHGFHDAQLQLKRKGRDWKGRERNRKWKKEKERGKIQQPNSSLKN